MRCGWLFVDEVASSITVARSRGRDERGVIAQEVSYLREGRISHTDAVLADEDIVAVVYEGLAKRHLKSRSRGGPDATVGATARQ